MFNFNLYYDRCEKDFSMLESRFGQPTSKFGWVLWYYLKYTNYSAARIDRVNQQSYVATFMIDTLHIIEGLVDSIECEGWNNVVVADTFYTILSASYIMSSKKSYRAVLMDNLPTGKTGDFTLRIRVNTVTREDEDIQVKYGDIDNLVSTLLAYAGALTGSDRIGKAFSLIYRDLKDCEKDKVSISTPTRLVTELSRILAPREVKVMPI